MDGILGRILFLEHQRSFDEVHHCKLVLGLDGQLGHSSFLVHQHIEFVGWIDKLGQHCNISLKVSIFTMRTKYSVLNYGAKEKINFLHSGLRVLHFSLQ